MITTFHAQRRTMSARKADQLKLVKQKQWKHVQVETQARNAAMKYQDAIANYKVSFWK